MSDIACSIERVATIYRLSNGCLHKSKFGRLVRATCGAPPPGVKYQVMVAILFRSAVATIFSFELSLNTAEVMQNVGQFISMHFHLSPLLHFRCRHA